MLCTVYSRQIDGNLLLLKKSLSCTLNKRIIIIKFLISLGKCIYVQCTCTCNLINDCAM